jgi:hypothetical protein
MQVFHLDVCMYLQWLHTCFQVFSGVSQVFQTYVVNVSFVSDLCYSCVYQNVVKVDRVLHILPWDPPAAPACCKCWGTTVVHCASA